MIGSLRNSRNECQDYENSSVHAGIAGAGVVLTSQQSLACKYDIANENWVGTYPLLRVG